MSLPNTLTVLSEPKMKVPQGQDEVVTEDDNTVVDADKDPVED